MSDHLGGQLNLTPEGVIMVALIPHTYVPPKRRRDSAGRMVVDPFCAVCGYHQLANVKDVYVHPDEKPEVDNAPIVR